MAKFIHFRWTNVPDHTTGQVVSFLADTWRPALNAYRCDGCIRVCFDLAGVDKEKIDIRIETGRLVIQGYRPPPEPTSGEPCARQILAMEIDHGNFLRELRIPEGVLQEEVTAEHRNGMLWINLPLSDD